MRRQMFSKDGVHISTFICQMFAKQVKNRYPDETMALMLAEAFPNGPGEVRYKKYIPIYRNRYNRGEIAGQTAPPIVPLIRYADGKPSPPRRGPKPRLPNEKPQPREF